MLSRSTTTQPRRRRHSLGPRYAAEAMSTIQNATRPSCVVKGTDSSGSTMSPKLHSPCALDFLPLKHALLLTFSPACLHKSRPSLASSCSGEHTICRSSQSCSRCVIGVNAKKSSLQALYQSVQVCSQMACFMPTPTSGSQVRQDSMVMTVWQARDTSLLVKKLSKLYCIRAECEILQQVHSLYSAHTLSPLARCGNLIPSIGSPS
mmetsp:Transcript_37321/g.62812  ORF Transcript_37321/g.62812 Transcript_37321/m.62812 type:complete len:206 (-) Transcript_37321:380-997(-)